MRYEKVMKLQSWKRKGIFLLATSAALFSLFWVTAFSTEKVDDMEAGKAKISHPVITAPVRMTKSIPIMDVDRTILHKGSKDWI